jgi:hypothetical protein
MNVRGLLLTIVRNFMVKVWRNDAARSFNTQNGDYHKHIMQRTAGVVNTIGA